MKRRILLLAVAIAVITVLICWYAASKRTENTNFVMGSVLTQTIWTQPLRPSVCGSITEAIEQLEDDLLNAEQAPALALEIMDASGGAFDPWLGAIVKLWNINGEPYLPTQEEIDQALERRALDLGAYGKGAACDEALRILQGSCKAAVVNLGGNILTYGQKPWGKPFQIALRDPRGGPNETIGTFTLRGTRFISTSGSYEKFFEQDGQKYHHIFDPQTGYPAEREPGLISVTVISQGKNGGATGDAVSTACFVLGYEASQELLSEYHCDALFIYENGDIRSAGQVMEYWSPA